MKYITTILLSLVGCLSVYAQTLDDNLVKAAAIVDGLFFDKSMPTKSIIPGGSTLSILQDPDGAKVLGVYLPEGYVLEQSVKAKAIPATRVQYADKLLRDYNGRKPQAVGKYEGIGVKAGEPMIPFEYPDIDGNVWNNEKLKGRFTS